MFVCYLLSIIYYQMPYQCATVLQFVQLETFFFLLVSRMKMTLQRVTLHSRFKLVSLSYSLYTFKSLFFQILTGLTTGFSHLEWSSTVPYNLAEEPDDVQGMKHSHSCHSMPGTRYCFSIVATSELSASNFFNSVFLYN